MLFLFFNCADKVLFSRDDMESADWSVDQLSLQATFPYNPGKEIERGMRVGFVWDGDWQVFEVRKAKSYEPDHYQEITAEHIAISELTDEIYNGEDVSGKTARQALEPMLNGTLWQIGNVTDSGTSSMDGGISNVWNYVRDVEQNWNVIITPRVTVGASGITGRYLDIAPNVGTWRGVRLSLEKNADELGVTWDDSEVKTALYGYGREKDGVKLTFADEVWTATEDHPAKPSGQTYLEDPTAKNLYGRNGRNRYGYYQNSAIEDEKILLQKTWETLQTLNAPRVTINCIVHDLYRLGYKDQPLRLHDKVMVEIRPQNKTLVLDVIKLDINLLDPTATRPTIGAYIPNIIYIDKDNGDKARGGGGGGSGKTKLENELQEFNSQIIANGARIALEEYQRAYEDGQLSDSLLEAWASINLDADKITSLVTGTGAQLNPDGSLVVDPVTGDPVFVTTGGGLFSKITQNSQQIALRVVKGDVATQLAVECGNVSVTGGNLTVDGYVTATSFDGLEARFDNLVSGTTAATKLLANQISASSSLSLGSGGSLFLFGTACSLLSQTVVTGATITMPSITLSNTRNMMYAINGDTSNPGTMLGQIVTAYTAGSRSVSTTNLHYVGYTS